MGGRDRKQTTYLVRYRSRKLFPFQIMNKKTKLAASPTKAAEMKQFW